MCRYLCAVFLVVSQVALLSEASIARKSPSDPVSPELIPKSHKKFFDKEYPVDDSPSPKGLGFGQPYPIVQDSNDFDKDYVKDSNKDDGLFEAQVEYDSLRNRLANAKIEADRARIDEQMIVKELEESEYELQNAGGGEDSAAEGSKDLQDCRKKLAEVRAELKRLTELKDKVGETGELVSVLQARVKEAEAVEKEAEAEVAKRQQEYDASQKLVDKQANKIAEMEKSLKAAQKKVAAIRGVDVDTPAAKPVPSAASPLASPLAGCLISTVLIVLATAQAS